MTAQQQQQQSYIAIRDDATLLSNAERDFVILAAAGVRVDGRQPHQARPVQLEFVRHDDSSSSVTVRLGGGTRVTAQVTGELVPVLSASSARNANEGVLAITVDLSAAASVRYRHASPASNTGSSSSSEQKLPLPDRHQKLAANAILRSLERCLSQALDLEALCVVPNRYVWKLSVHVTVVDDSGNLVDASTLACLAALRHYRQPIVTTTTSTAADDASASVPTILPANVKEPTPLPLHHTPLTLTFALLQKDDDDNRKKTNTTAQGEEHSLVLLLDPTDREELACQNSVITLALNAHSELCWFDYCSGGMELTVPQLRLIYNTAVAHVPAMVEQLEQALQTADQQVWQERLTQLQQQQQQQELPPLPPQAPPAVPYFAETTELTRDVTTTNVTVDRQVAQQASDAAAKEEEAYRRRALDYNRGHVASRLRSDNDDSDPKHSNNNKNKNKNNLLAAMLASVQQQQQGNNKDVSTTTTTTPDDQRPAALVDMELDDDNEHDETISDAPKPTSAASSSNVETKTKKTPPPNKTVVDDDDEEDEATTMQLESEFQSITTTTATSSSNKPPPPKTDNKDDDDDNVDDLAAAIKKSTAKKKKKSKSKKK